MKNNFTLSKSIILGFIIFLVVCIIIYYIIKLKNLSDKKLKKSEQKYKTYENGRIKNLKKHNPEIDEETLKLFFDAYYIILYNYDLYSKFYVLPQKTNANQTVLTNNEKSFVIDMSKTSRKTENWRDEFFNFSIEKTRGGIKYILNDFDKFIISNNSSLIDQLIIHTQRDHNENFKDKLIVKQLKTTDKKISHVSVAQLMFSKYIQFFKLEK